MNKIKFIIEKNEVDGILLTDFYNKRYLTGFTGTTGIALASIDKKYFYSDSRYTLQATEQVAKYGFEFVEAGKNLIEVASEYARELGIKKLGIDEENINLSEFDRIKKLFKDTEFIFISKDLKEIRQQKSEEEIENIKKACEISDKAFNEVIKIIKPGMTEKEIAGYIEYIQRINGATDRSFETIVASGPRSSMPHGVATDRKVQENEFITMDFGCYYNGYVSDMTRTVYLGENISDEERNIYEAVLEAHKLGIKLVLENNTGAYIDKKVREYLEEKGYGKYFTHSLGHGIGLEIHESPYLSKINEKGLKINEIVTIEPGVYIDNFCGVRIEDDILVTENGPVSLNKSNKELILIKVEK